MKTYIIKLHSDLKATKTQTNSKELFTASSNANKLQNSWLASYQAIWHVLLVILFGDINMVKINFVNGKAGKIRTFMIYRLVYHFQV